MSDEAGDIIERFEEKPWVHSAVNPHENVIVVLEKTGQSDNPKTFAVNGWEVVARLPSAGGDGYVFVSQGGDSE